MGLTLTLCRMTYAVQNGLKVVPTAQLPAYIPLGYTGRVMLHPWFLFVLFSRSPVMFIAYNSYPNMYAASEQIRSSVFELGLEIKLITLQVFVSGPLKTLFRGFRAMR